MDLSIPYKQSSDAAAAYEVVKKNITPQTIERFKVKADLYYDDMGRLVTATGTGFTLKMSFYDTEAVIDLDMSFLLKPMKKQVLNYLEHNLGKLL